MGNCAAKRRFGFGASLGHMDEVVIMGGIGKGVDHFLGNHDPIGRALGFDLAGYQVCSVDSVHAFKLSRLHQKDQVRT